MKTAIALATFFVFTSLSFLAEYITDTNEIAEFNLSTLDVASADKITAEEFKSISTYKIDVNFDESSKTIFVSGILNWVNKSDTVIEEILMNIPSNSNEDCKLKYNIELSKIFEQYEYEFIPTESKMFSDSTLVKLKLKNELNVGDTLKFNFNFSMTASAKEKWEDPLFLQFENWYPKIAVLTSGEFEAYPHHKYIKSYSEFSDYEVSITIPTKYQIVVSGMLDVSEDADSKTYHCLIRKIPSFNWMVFSNYIESSSEISTLSDNVDLKIFVQKGNENYIPRYSEAVEKYLNVLSKYFDLPYESLSIIELSQNDNLHDRSYPGILATNSSIISPVGSQYLEFKIASLLAEQYFGNIVVSNNYKQAWISKGVSAYIAEKLVRKEYGELYSYFNLANSYPVKGLHFFSYSDIPLIYTIGEQHIPEGARFISEFYKNSIYGNLATSSYQFPNYEAFRVASIVKPQLALLTLERYLGSEKLFRSLGDYYNKYKYQHPGSDQFLKIITDGCISKSDGFLVDLFKSGKRFDYAIKYLKKNSENNYEMLVERMEEGISPIKINIYTDSDTLRLTWNGEDYFKRFDFYSKNEVISAELDPERENILDMNFSNNSYVIETKYWGSLSFATRVFFWFQNALMIIGSIG